MILVKTQAGQDALKDRHGSLSSRQRSAFILFDGKRTTAEILAATAAMGIMGRDMNTIANFAPGVADSGFAMGVSIAGASAAENSYVLDGLNTTDTRYGVEGNSLVTDFIDQVEVQTGGFKPLQIVVPP